MKLRPNNSEMSETLYPKILVIFQLSINDVKFPFKRAVQFISFKYWVKLKFNNDSMSETLAPKIVVTLYFFNNEVKLPTKRLVQS